MPQMSPLSWTIMIISSISLLLGISSFLYFMYSPNPNHLYMQINLSINYPSNHTFTWSW